MRVLLFLMLIPALYGQGQRRKTGRREGGKAREGFRVRIRLSGPKSPSRLPAFLFFLIAGRWRVYRMGNPMKYFTCAQLGYVAWLAVASRLAGVIFFVGFQPAAYHPLGYFDLVFFVPEAILLVMASRAAGRTGEVYV